MGHKWWGSDKNALLLGFKAEGLSYAEIGSRLGYTPKQIRDRCSRLSLAASVNGTETKWTKDMDGRLIAAHGCDKTFVDIGIELGVSMHAARRRALRLGLPARGNGYPATKAQHVGGRKPGRSMTPEELDRAVECRIQGMTYKEIANRTGVSEDQVKTRLRRAGIRKAKVVSMKVETLPPRLALGRPIKVEPVCPPYEEWIAILDRINARLDERIMARRAA